MVWAPLCNDLILPSMRSSATWRSTLRFLLTVLIAAPFVFAWAYVRPQPNDAGSTLIAVVVGLIITLGALYVANRIVEVVASGRSAE